MIGEEASVADEAARQIESEVIDELYKTTVGKLGSRREQFKAAAETGAPIDGASKERYKNYLEELRKEYKFEKEEKIRNKSFEYDKTSRSLQESTLNGNLANSNILASYKDAEINRLENDQRARDKETVIVRNEIRNRTATAGFGASARVELLQESRSEAVIHSYDRPEIKVSELSRDQLAKKEDVSGARMNDVGERTYKPHLASLEHREFNYKEQREEIPRYQEARYRQAGLSTEDLLESSRKQRETRDYLNTAKGSEQIDSGIRQPEIRSRIAESYSSQRGPRDIYQATTLAGGSDYDSKMASSPKAYNAGLGSDSSDKKLYNWNDDKSPEESKRFARDKSPDPFEDKTLQRYDGPSSKEQAPKEDRLDPARPPLRDRSPVAKDDMIPLQSERGRPELKNPGFDKLYHTEREKREDPRGKSPDLSPLPHRDTDHTAMLGKSKRLETENHILLKNNAELRRENNELREKLNEKGNIQELKDKIRELTEKNRRLELQLMSQQNSPLLMPKTPQVQTHQFFNEYSATMDSGRLRGKSSENLHSHHESFKHLPHTERRKMTKDRDVDKVNNTRLKFADSVVGMLRQLVDLQQGEDECKHAWKILKSMVGEYVDLKRERKHSPGSSSFLQKNGNSTLEQSDYGRTERTKQRSEERNKWRERNPPTESRHLKSRLG